VGIVAREMKSDALALGVKHWTGAQGKVAAPPAGEARGLPASYAIWKSCILRREGKYPDGSSRHVRRSGARDERPTVGGETFD